MRAPAYAAAFSVLLASSPAWPCGGGFGEGVVVDPDQTIVVSWTGQLGMPGGIETYVMQPYFCGAAAQLALIMPVPSPLVASPEMGDAALVTELEALTQPTVTRECRPTGIGCGAAAKRGSEADGYDPGAFDPGVSVVDTGRVGIFDWVLLQATSPSAFTDWLDANQFPYASTSLPHFDYYVAQGWYFVAFRITTGPDAPPAGSKLCGTLGPLVLRFQADGMPVIPARIAAVNQAAGPSNPVWRIFTLASEPLQPSYAGQFLFSGAVAKLDVSRSPAVAAFADPSAYLTKANAYLPVGGPSEDLALGSSNWPVEYRHEVVEYEDCGCAASSSDVGQALVGALLALQLPLVWRRWSRRPRLAAARAVQ